MKVPPSLKIILDTSDYMNRLAAEFLNGVAPAKRTGAQARLLAVLAVPAADKYRDILIEELTAYVTQVSSQSPESAPQSPAPAPGREEVSAAGL